MYLSDIMSKNRQMVNRMKTRIYYFSGTGNSLSVAKNISSCLDGSSLISIPQAMEDAEKISATVIGIVCPIYMYNMPHIVANFIGKIKNTDYFFIVYAGGGQLGNGDKETYKICAQNNLKLSALFNIPMPDNYTPYGCPSTDEQLELIGKSHKKITSIVATVRSRQEHRDSSNSSFFESNIHPGLLYKLGYSRIRIMAQTFTVDESCNDCGICQKVCPVNNIEFMKQKPKWGSNCEQCYACLQWCPQKSIQYGNKTQGIERYQNPNVKVKEIMDSAKRG